MSFSFSDQKLQFTYPYAMPPERTPKLQKKPFLPAGPGFRIRIRIYLTGLIKIQIRIRNTDATGTGTLLYFCVLGGGFVAFRAAVYDGQYLATLL